METKEKYIVVNQYGIGGDKGEIAYSPKSYGKKSHEACQEWCKRNDRVGTMMIVRDTDLE